MMLPCGRSLYGLSETHSRSPLGRGDRLTRVLLTGSRKLGRPSQAYARNLPGRTVEVRRARFGPGLRPGPRRQVRWGGRGLRGQGWALAPIALATRRRRALEAGGAAPENARQGRCG